MLFFTTSALTIARDPTCFPCQVTKRDLLLSARTIYLIGREKVASGPEKGQTKDVVKRRIPVAQVQSVALR